MDDGAVSAGVAESPPEWLVHRAVHTGMLELPLTPTSRRETSSIHEYRIHNRTRRLERFAQTPPRGVDLGVLLEDLVPGSAKQITCINPLPTNKQTIYRPVRI